VPPTFVPLTLAKTTVFFIAATTHILRMLFGPEGKCGRNAGVVIPGSSCQERLVLAVIKQKSNFLVKAQPSN
jgi:hypothetical protein